MKKQAKKTNIKTKSELTIVLEHIEDKFQIISEGYFVLDNKIDKLDISLNQKIDESNKSLNQKIDSFKEETAENFEIVFKRLDKIDNRLFYLENEVSEIKKEIKKEKKEKNTLVVRINNIEKELKRLKARLV
jgi:chromosome segregation ATPase